MSSNVSIQNWLVFMGRPIKKNHAQFIFIHLSICFLTSDLKITELKHYLSQTQWHVMKLVNRGTRL